MMEYDANTLRNHFVMVCQKHKANFVARAAAGRVCYPAIVKALRQLHPAERRAILRDFFAPFPNGETFAKTTAMMLDLNFEDPAPIRDLTVPVAHHLEAMGLGPAVVKRVEWRAGGRNQDLHEDWVEAYRTYRMTETIPHGALGVFLREITTETLMSLPHTDLGKTAVHEPRTFIQRLLWAHVDGKASPWDFLGLVAMHGWIPVGLGVEGDVFFVAQLPEQEPVKL